MKINARVRIKIYLICIISLFLSLFLMGSGGTGYSIDSEDLITQLDLSEEQRKRHAHIFWNYIKKSKPLFSDLIEMSIELQKTINEESVEKPNVDKQIYEIANIDASLKIAQIELVEDFLKYLNPTQKQEFKEMIGDDYRIPTWGLPELSDLFSGASLEKCNEYCDDKETYCRGTSSGPPFSYKSDFCREAWYICKDECKKQY